MSLLVVVAANGGSGGSTVARYIATNLLPGAEHLDKDEKIADKYTPLRDSSEYMAVRGMVYDELRVRMHCYLGHGSSVVLSSSFRKELTSNAWIRQNLEEVCDAYCAELRIVQLVISEEELRRRVATRGLPRDLEMLEDWDARIRSEPVSFHVPHMNVLKIDVVQPVEIYGPDLRGFLAPRMNFDGVAAGMEGLYVVAGGKTYIRQLTVAGS